MLFCSLGKRAYPENSHAVFSHLLTVSIFLFLSFFFLSFFFLSFLFIFLSFFLLILIIRKPTITTPNTPCTSSRQTPPSWRMAISTLNSTITTQVRKMNTGGDCVGMSFCFRSAFPPFFFFSSFFFARRITEGLYHARHISSPNGHSEIIHRQQSNYIQTLTFRMVLSNLHQSPYRQLQALKWFS